ncbi:MAG: peptidylprolyl isomerase [Bacteroidales bacterium]
MKRIFFAIMAIVLVFGLSAIAQTNPQVKAPAKSTAKAPAKAPSKMKILKFVIHTDYGDMKGMLYNETPLHRKNFDSLVRAGFYNGTLFHRVILGFMIQGGDPASKTAKPGQALGMGGPGYTVPAEIKPTIVHKRGALAAARIGGPSNPQKASSGSQFYIVQPESGTHQLDNDYTVFGEITEGFDVITKIASVQKDAGDRPVKDVKMTIKMVK